MLPLLALLPTIFGAISKTKELFSSGKKAIKEITGQTSGALTPNNLKTEFQAMTPEQQDSWIKTMDAKVKMYTAQNERLEIEQGKVDTSKISTEAADKIAVSRQTTRPWAVRMMIHYIFFPCYLVCLDVIQHLTYSWLFSWWYAGQSLVFNSFEYVFGVYDITKIGTIEKFTSLLSSPLPKTLMATVYMDTVSTAGWIVITYMGLREAGKSIGTSGDTALKSGSGIGSIISKGISLFKK